MNHISMYDVCDCNHESMLHLKGTNHCFAKTPVGKESYRGWVSPEMPSKTCSCKKFKYSRLNSERISSSEEK